MCDARALWLRLNLKSGQYRVYSQSVNAMSKEMLAAILYHPVGPR